jgi:hypothetical protein
VGGGGGSANGTLSFNNPFPITGGRGGNSDFFTGGAGSTGVFNPQRSGAGGGGAGYLGNGLSATFLTGGGGGLGGGGGGAGGAGVTSPGTAGSGGNGAILIYY